MQNHESHFFPARLVATAKENVRRYPWAAAIRNDIVAAAQPWLKLSDDELRALMFGSTIRRAWMVWSNGHCPACKKDVLMYTWQIAALERPWKLRCPHCAELFPKNDFEKFHRSGLDAHGIFDHLRADRSLLFNTEHPDPADPLHRFGVDDGTGYREDDHCWWFVGAYLVYGQWKQAMHGGICKLAAAHVVTGALEYAHRAGVLLARVAELYSTFDFGTQGVMYEAVCQGEPYAGYVSTWHDACQETLGMTMAYDQIRPALDDETRGKIEQGILRHALDHPRRIYCNYPCTDITVASIKLVLGGEQFAREARELLDTIMKTATAVDGLTGEKGISSYSFYVINALAGFLEQLQRIEPGFLRELLRRHPRLHAMYRFHIDTWCLQKYYTNEGDAGGFATPSEYCGAGCVKRPGLEPSKFDFLWHLYQITGDIAFVQVIYRANGNSTEELPHSLFADDPEAIQRAVRDVIEREGTDIRLGSVNKTEWGLAILRSGRDKHARAAWLDCDSGNYGHGKGRHAHFEGIHIGLFAKGLDLMPDFGYPPVQFGGWHNPRADWYRMAAAHNTVVVDGDNHPAHDGRTTLWADGRFFRAVRAEAIPPHAPCTRFERTIVMVDIADGDFYLVDVCRVAGGRDHAKLFHSHFGAITTRGLSLRPAADYGHGTQMRHFVGDLSPKPGWSVEWKIEDRQQLLPPGSDVRLRYTDLTNEAAAFTCEGWIATGSYNDTGETWIPRIMVRRADPGGPLVSTFVSVIELFEMKSNIAHARRLSLAREGDVAIEIELRDGRRDLVVLGDSPPGEIGDEQTGLRTDAEACLIRRDSTGKVSHAALSRGARATVRDEGINLSAKTDFQEMNFDGK